MYVKCTLNCTCVCTNVFTREMVEFLFRVSDGRRKASNFTKLHHDIGSDYGQIGILLGRAQNLEAKRFELLKIFANFF